MLIPVGCAAADERERARESFVPGKCKQTKMCGEKYALGIFLVLLVSDFPMLTVLNETPYILTKKIRKISLNVDSVLTILLKTKLSVSTNNFIRYRSLDDHQVIPLDKPQQLFNSTCINHAFPTIVYTFGYRGKVAGPATNAILSAYLATKKRNVILLDWEEEARSGILGLPLGYILSAVPSAKQIGDDLGEALTKLARSGMNMTQVHLLGHSLGAHLMAYAGRRARENGHVVARITGLDPARALFEGSFSRSGLDRKCARFVDIIHSDPGGYGTSTPSGTVDFWPNYAGNGGTQPGCPNGDFDMFSPEDKDRMSESEFAEYYVDYEEIRNMTGIEKIQMATKRNLCSHDRSWRYFVESIASPTAFPASFSEDYNSWVERAGRNIRSSKTIYMGDLTNSRAQGDFYLTTASKSPYSMGQLGLIPDDNQPRQRRSSTLTRLLKYLR